MKQTNVPGQEAVFKNGDSFNADDTERKQSSFVPNVFPSCISPPTGYLVQDVMEQERDVSSRLSSTNTRCYRSRSSIFFFNKLLSCAGK